MAVPHYDLRAKDSFQKSRLSILMVFCLMTAGIVWTRAAYIQLLPQPRLRAMAERQFVTHTLVRPRRGAILDRNGEPLAISVEVFSLAANPRKLKKKPNLAKLLSNSTGIASSKILNKLKEDREFVWIKRHLDDAELKRFKKWRVMDEDGELIDGLWLVRENSRVYPHKQVASHILGAVNIDSEGIEGIELKLDDVLRGKVVAVSAVKDALGRPTFIDAEAAKNVQDGEEVRLTIDATLQFEVEQKLRQAVQKTGSQSGTVIVMNAANGEILAMANEPSFDSNQKSTPPEFRRNRAVTDGYEPGSILKPMLAAAALAHGWKLSDEVWGERGSFSVQGYPISEAEAHEKFEWVTLSKMIQVSSNIAAAKIALKLGADHYFRALKAFGFGSKTGLEFPGEIAGNIPLRKNWTPLTLANIGFGQGIVVTPLQMTRAYAAILNEGRLVTPRLIKPETPDQSFLRTVSPGATRETLKALLLVTEQGGTGTKAALPGYHVAGKTGTAQVVDSSTRKYSKEKYIASFVGFALDVEPRIVIFTSLSAPKGIYYASETAAPLFKEVLESVANRCSLPVRPAEVTPNLAKIPKVSDEIKLSQASAIVSGSANSGAGVPPPSADSLELQIDPVSGRAVWAIPSFKGYTSREAIQRLRGHFFKLEMVGSGIVKSQDPPPGKTVAEGARIRLVLAEP